MRKVFTLFCVLMAAFFSIGVANAQSALTSFEVSTKPTGNTFDANTHWYVMKLKGMFITVENVDGEGNIKLTADNTLTSTNIKSGADQWCIVGSDSEGYQLYNKKAGVTKVLGLENATSTVQSESHYTNYGKSRAQMYDAATTTSSAADGKVGTTFVIRSKEGKPATSFFIGLKDANVTNRYFNSRGDYLAYWQDNGSYGDDGSVVTFYDAETYWTTYWDLENLDLDSYKALATTVSNLQGTTPFTTYPAEAVSAFKTVVDNAEGNLSHVEAIALKSTLNAAKWTLRKSINGPAAGSIYKMKGTYSNKFIHAPYSFAAGNDIPLSATDNDRTVGWIFEPNTTNGTYKIKSADTGMYIGGTTNFKSVANSSAATDFVIAAETDGGISTVVVGTGDDLNAHRWFHSNDNNNLIAWAADAGASKWEFTEVSASDYANLNDLRLASVLSVLGVDANNETISSALTAYNESVHKTAEKWNNLANAVNQILDSKYYRIKNLRNNKQNEENYTILATDGNLKPKMYQPTQSQYLVSTIWKFKVGNGGLLLSNVNNPNLYVAALTNASVAAQGGTANDFTASDNAELFVLSKADNVDYYVIRDVKGNLLNGEDSGNFPLNYWNGGLGQKSTQWQINEATSLEVALNSANNQSYASVYLPFSISSVNDGVKVFVAKQPGTNKVTFTETTHGVMAENGFLLISDNAATTTATVNIGESNTESNMLGTLTNCSLTNADKSTYRVFGRNSNNVVGFFTPSGTLDEVKANRGFFKVATGGALRLNFEDSVVSGIDAIEANQALHNAPIFDLSGRRVMNTVKGGLYIQNGRKFIVK